MIISKQVRWVVQRGDGAFLYDFTRQSYTDDIVDAIHYRYEAVAKSIAGAIRDTYGLNPIEVKKIEIIIAEVA